MEDLKRIASSIIDSEYDNLIGFGPDDLFDYLTSLIVDITREQSDELYNQFF